MIADEDCRREALDWMILLQERPDDAGVRARFRHWRRSPACDAAWRDLDHVGDMVRLACEAYPVSSPYVPRRWTRVLPVVMAGAIAAIFVGQVLLPFAEADFVTGTGEVRRVRLADGSRVTLAPDSAIALDGARQVRLLRGTGFFEVRHNAAHPFRVKVGEAVATDLGTAFEVRRDDDGAHIAVREGRVRASCEHGAIDPSDMQPGDVAELDCATAHVRKSSAPPSAIASWTQGQLVMADRPLGEVVAALRPWHRGLLLARGSGMARHVTGVYDLRRPDRALAAIRRAHGATVWQVTPWITIVTAG
ncbi:FecR domain-containing protein [Sphingomonas sp. GM_Shp_1]|uniref:FecR family protein n=1 Tax=Sphingomonas sp. GM_Shp_1 TaxID=2937381 RepID=UPI00226B6315|nr:FecR domain-containing protein [Sphingomonas sp. GM_Shp_1]